MPTPDELKAQFWRELKSDMTVMLGLVGAGEAHFRPMTAQIEGDAGGPIHFFTAKSSAIIGELHRSREAMALFASKGHGLFASVHGRLSLFNDRATIDRLWNPFVAAWYKGGKSDPELALLRFDADRAEIWENGSSIVAGIKLLFGADPKRDYKDKVAKVAM
jgi:general stress protein 26